MNGYRRPNRYPIQGGGKRGGGGGRVGGLVIFLAASEIGLSCGSSATLPKGVQRKCLCKVLFFSGQDF